jgi:hypothetical protein
MQPFHNRPVAAQGLKSYRYKGRYGWIMIGAKDHADALVQAQCSTDDTVTPDRLQYWTGVQYQAIDQALATH